MNQRDPLKVGPQAEQHLYNAMQPLAHGYNRDAVIGAAINLIANAIRQHCATRKEAEAVWDMFFGRGKSLLLEQHYDSTTGRRKSVFPFTQVLGAPLHIEDDDLKR